MSGTRTTKHQPPVAVAEVVQRTITALTAQRGAAAMVDFPSWKTLVGVRIARRAQPVTLRQSTVVVHVTDAALLYELSLRMPELVAGLKQALPAAAIRDVRLRVGAVQW